MVARHDLGEAVLQLALRDSENDFIDDGGMLENQERMQDNRLSAEREKLFGDRPAHPKPSSGGRDERND
jgi:hypothetical protein